MRIHVSHTLYFTGWQKKKKKKKKKKKTNKQTNKKWVTALILKLTYDQKLEPFFGKISLLGPLLPFIIIHVCMRSVQIHMEIT